MGWLDKPARIAVTAILICDFMRSVSTGRGSLRHRSSLTWGVGVADEMRDVFDRHACWYTSETMTCGINGGVRSARTMHSGFIGSVLTLSPWTPPGLNGCAVSARPAPTWPQVAHHPRLKGTPSVPDQRKRRRRMEAIMPSDEATAGSWRSPPRAFSSLPW